MKRIVFIISIIATLNCTAQNVQELFTKFKYLDSLIATALVNNPEGALNWIKEQDKIAERLKSDSLQFNAVVNKARVFGQLSIYDVNLKILYDLLAKAEAENKCERIGKVKYLLGATYLNMFDYKKSLANFEEAKKVYLNCKEYEDTLNVNAELGLQYVIAGEEEKGILLLKQTIENFKKLPPDKGLANAIDNLSNSYYGMDDLKNAIAYQLLLVDNTYINSNIEGRTAVNQHLAELYCEDKQYDKAQAYVTKAIAYGEKMKSNFWLFDCYKNQAAIFEAKGNYKGALLYHQKYLASKDSVYQKDYANKMSAMHNLYELDKKQNQINTLAKDKVLDSLKIQRLTLGLITLMLTALFISIANQLRKNKKERKQKEQFAQQLLNAQEEERQRIAKDLHDSVGQNILFIKNQLQSPNKNESALLQSIDTALEEVRNISKNLYPNQLEKYGLAKAVQTLSEQVNKTTGIFISSDMKGIDEALNKNVQINFYRIIQEFINNTLKHANATSIRITTELNSKEIVLLVQDNGKGFDTNILQSKAHNSFGILNMEERIKMLKGNVTIESEKGKGTKSRFTIPI